MIELLAEWLNLFIEKLILEIARAIAWAFGPYELGFKS